LPQPDVCLEARLHSNIYGSCATGSSNGRDTHIGLEFNVAAPFLQALHKQFSYSPNSPSWIVDAPVVSIAENLHHIMALDTDSAPKTSYAVSSLAYLPS